MHVFIPQTLLKLMLFLVFPLLLTGCNSSTAARLNDLEIKYIILPSGEKIKTYMAITHEQQKQGLSQIKPEDFPLNEAMFFPGNRMFYRQFWMPETYFNLDIIFLDKSLYVIDIHRNLSKYHKREPKHLVPISKAVFSQHVLEVRAQTELSKKIQPGMILKWEKN